MSLTSLDEARRYARAAVNEALDALKTFGGEADFLRELVEYLIARKK